MGVWVRSHPAPFAAADRSPKRLYAFDIDQEGLSWVNEYLPWVETSCTDGLPPLAYADATFDLIFNHSVMTHLECGLPGCMPRRTEEGS